MNSGRRGQGDHLSGEGERSGKALTCRVLKRRGNLPARDDKRARKKLGPISVVRSAQKDEKCLIMHFMIDVVRALPACCAFHKETAKNADN